MCVCVYLEEQGIVHVLSVDGGQAVLVVGGQVYLVPCQDVAHRPTLLDLLLEHLLQTLVLQLAALHLTAQLWNTHSLLEPFRTSYGL